jgi:hypothetical protein
MSIVMGSIGLYFSPMIIQLTEVRSECKLWYLYSIFTGNDDQDNDLDVYDDEDVDKTPIRDEQLRDQGTTRR